MPGITDDQVLRLLGYPSNTAYNQGFAGENRQFCRFQPVHHLAMAKKHPIETVIEKAVSEVVQAHLGEMQEKLVKQVLEGVWPLMGSASSDGGGASELLKAISTVHAGTTQKEILRALLDGTDGYCGRSALFVVKGGSANGWQGRAFDNNADVKDFSLDTTSTAPEQVLQNRTTFSGKTSDMDAKFISQFGAPAEEQILLLPLHLKDKVAALVYADAGTDAGGKIDAASLELLVSVTSAWLEVVSLRKQAAKESTGEPAEKSDASPVPVQAPAQSFNDPFAAHAPKHVMTAAAEPVVAVSAGAAAAAAPAPDSFAQMSAEDADVHRKAQRFARLLMDEVKLYNQAKVAEGRKHKDLYDRLKEDIEKSRSTYTKRYGNTVAAGMDHFSNEVVRSLAEDDASLLGPNFKR